MRSAAAFLLICLTLPAVVTIQQPAARPKKVLTPEQQEYQRKSKEVNAQRDALRAQAKAAFDDEMTREKAGDCPNAMTTYDANVCYGKTADITDKNLKTFTDALRSMLALHYPDMPGPAPAGSTNSRTLTPEQHVAEFDQIETQWSAYASTACGAVYHSFEGGTGGPSAKIECHLRLVRNHLRELDSIYEVTHPH
jgi:uncharacterized protein YecT (DUF1311 family)